jgi:hypothetical protein
MYSKIQEGRIGDKIVVLAVFPGTTSIESLKRLLDSIAKSSFTILVVVNKAPTEVATLNLLFQYDCTVILRPNIGRDIGAYQCGLFYLGIDSLSSKFEKIALINDTLYTTEKSKDFYEKFLESEDWNCLYFNYQDIAHASSHSLILDQNALLSEKVISFWKSYYPSSSRWRSIFKGEFGITASLGQDYFKAMVSHELFRNKDYDLQLSEQEKFQLRIWCERSVSIPNHALLDYIEKNQVLDALHFSLEKYQVSNSLGIFLYNSFQIPIKLDICKQGLISTNSFLNLVTTDMSTEEIFSIRELLKPHLFQAKSPMGYKIKLFLYNIRKYF